MLKIDAGGEGPDCDLPFCSEVMCVMVEDYDAISVFFVPLVTYNPTDKY
jgi:hypothetical protein